MKRFGLIGASLGHSLSADLFARKFKAAGLKDHRYDLYELADIEEFPTLLAERKDLVGLNVTIPYKRAVMPLLDAIDPQALAVGAVNTISIKEGRTTGHNTDVAGFRGTLLPLIGKQRPRALVLGTGGASRAVTHVLRELDMPWSLVSRDHTRGDLTWDLLDRTVVGVCTLIVNTTPLGMAPHADTLPDLPYEAIGPRHILIDLVYNPENTIFLQRGRERGARVANGRRMLELQAEAAWAIWQGAQP